MTEPTKVEGLISVIELYNQKYPNAKISQEIVTELENAAGLHKELYTRDPNRIDPILIELAIYWKKNPDLRLGQIINNLSGTVDSFYIEDDKLLSILKNKNNATQT